MRAVRDTQKYFPFVLHSLDDCSNIALHFSGAETVPKTWKNIFLSSSVG